MSRPLRQTLTLALCLVMALLGLLGRLAYAPEILAADGPHVIPADSHYYLRFAQLQEGAFPAFRRFDPLVNAPSGAEILWPPLHTWLVRAAMVTLGTPEAPARGAVWVGPLSFLGWVFVLGALTRRWHGGPAAVWMIAALALPALAVRAGDLGQLDHHVHEGPWIALVLLLAHRLVQTPGTRTAVALGVALAAGRLLTTSGFLGVPLAALALVAGAALQRRDGPSPGRALWDAGAVTALVASTLMFLSSWAWGTPLSLDYTQLGGFHPLWTLAGLGSALGLCALLEGKAARGRAASSLLVALIALAPIVLSLRAGVGDALRADPVLAAASESRPLWGDPMGALTLLGQGWLLWAAAAAWAFFGARQAPAHRAALRHALVISAPMFLASLLQVRLTRLGAGAMAFAVALALPSLTGHLSRRVRPALLYAGAALLLLTSLAPLRPKGQLLEHEERHLRPTLAWLKAHTPEPGTPPSYAVLSTWTFGHLITAEAGRAAIATPFSQARVHVEGNARALAILSEVDEARAVARARESRVRYVLAAPYGGTVGPIGTQAQSLMARLLEDAGMPAGGEASAHFRLIHESLEDRAREEGGPLARVFELVEGAVLELRGPPGATVELELPLRSERDGRPLHYRRKTTLGASGHGQLRVPYATHADPHATVTAAGPYRVRLGGDRDEVASTVEVTLEAVRAGSAVPVPLPTGAAAHDIP